MRTSSKAVPLLPTHAGFDVRSFLLESWRICKEVSADDDSRDDDIRTTLNNKAEIFGLPECLVRIPALPVFSNIY